VVKLKTVETKPNTFWIDVIVLDEQVFEPGPQVIYRPSFDFEDRRRCYGYSREFARKVKEYHKKFGFG
jgi:hypothetical protein